MRIDPDAPGFKLVLDVDEATHGNRINLQHIADREERNMATGAEGRHRKHLASHHRQIRRS